MELKERVALVTGASSGGLGAAIARALATAGAHVAVGYVGNLEGAERTRHEVEALGRRACTIQIDQVEPASIEAGVDAVGHELGGLDLLVNNAAWNIGIPFPDLEALTPEVWDRIHDTNVRGPYLLARAAARQMRQRGAGRIVNIASIAGLRPSGSSIAYAASKAALIHLTRCLAVALAPDITVNCVAPGLMEGTRMAQRLPPGVAESARQLAVLRLTTGMDDVADQVVTFCRAASVTGQTLVIDGGVHFH
jgi:3-oxoacyl-[acyl-carrier protein] reductase